ncbi:MAG TPA: hypothetical protein V6C65_18870 [Allocoleopsis sp.]
MTFWFTRAKDGEVSRLSILEPETINADIEFNEAHLINDGDTWLLVMNLKNHFGNIKGKEDVKPGENICFEIHGGDYQRRVKDGSDWKNVDAKPTPIESFYVDWFKQNELAGKYFGPGKIGFQNNPTMLSMHGMNGIDLHAMDKPHIHTFKSEFIIPEASVLKGVKMPEVYKGKGSWGSRGGGQTEKQKLEDRLDFLHSLVAGNEKLDAIATVLNIPQDEMSAVLKGYLVKLFG